MRKITSLLFISALCLFMPACSPDEAESTESQIAPNSSASSTVQSEHNNSSQSDDDISEPASAANDEPSEGNQIVGHTPTAPTPSVDVNPDPNAPEGTIENPGTFNMREDDDLIGHVPQDQTPAPRVEPDPNAPLGSLENPDVFDMRED